MTQQTPQAWAKKITAAWRRSVEAIFECGTLLIAAKNELKHGEFEKMVELDLPFGPRTAQMYMQIADDKRLAKARCASLLPPSMSTLCKLARLTDEQFDDCLADGTICPEMRASDIPEFYKVTVEDKTQPPVTVPAVYVEPKATDTIEVVAYLPDAAKEPDDRPALDDDDRTADRLIEALEEFAALVDDTALADRMKAKLRALDIRRQCRIRQAAQVIGEIGKALSRRY